MDIQSSQKKTITGTFHLSPLIAGLLFVIDVYLNGKVGVKVCSYLYHSIAK